MREAWTFTRFWLGVIVTSCLALALQAQGTRKGVTQGCSLSSMRQVPGPIITATGNPVLDKKIDEELGLVFERFNVEPAFRIFQDGNTPNAFAVLENVMAGSSGTVLFGVNLMTQELAQTYWQGFSVPAIIAHEVAHLVQDKKGTSLTKTRKELQADYLAGWYLQQRATAAPANLNIQAAATSFFHKSDMAFWDARDHGTPRERTKAFLAGLQTRSGTIESAYGASLQWIAKQ